MDWYEKYEVTKDFFDWLSVIKSLVMDVTDKASTFKRVSYQISFVENCRKESDYVGQRWSLKKYEIMKWLKTKTVLLRKIKLSKKKSSVNEFRVK